LSAQAREHGIWIVGGTVPVGNRPDGTGVPGRRARAACFVFDSNGAEVARYDKIHMFDVKVEDNHKNYVESETFEPGDELVVIQSPIGKLGLSVCYDIRFPEMYRSLLHQGAEIISIPSAFTRVTGEAHWRALARARAIENSCFVIGACQWGKHDSGRETWGESLVVDPWGKVVEVMDNGTGLLLAELDLNLVRSIRADMPIESQTRLNISAPVHNRGNQPFEYPS
jgi:nitrilase